MAQSVEHPTLDVDANHDLTVVRLSLASGSVLGVEPAWDSFSSSLSDPHKFVCAHMPAISLSK